MLIVGGSFLDTSACNIDLNVTDTRQYITTVGYPRYYLDNQDCGYNFVAPSGRRILVFFEDVGLEKEYDYVVFRKYWNEFIPQLLTQNLYD